MPFRYAVYLAYKAGMNQVTTPFYWYISTSQLDCFAHIDTRDYPLSRKCRAMVKDLQTGERVYYGGIRRL